MLNKKISKDDKVAVLSIEANLLYTWLIPYADLKGRMIAIPGSIKWMVVPLLNYFNEENIKEYLLEIRDKGLIKLYGTDNIYLEMIGFSKNQRVDASKEAPSEIPTPDQLQSNSVAKLNKKLKLKDKDKEKNAEPSPAHSTKKEKQPNPELKRVIDHICITWENKRGRKYPFSSKHAKLIKYQCNRYEPAGVMALWDLYLKSNIDFAIKTGFSIEGFLTVLPQLSDMGYKSLKQRYEQRQGIKPAGEILKGLIDDKRTTSKTVD